MLFMAFTMIQHWLCTQQLHEWYEKIYASVCVTIIFIGSHSHGTTGSTRNTKMDNKRVRINDYEINVIASSVHNGWIYIYIIQAYLKLASFLFLYRINFHFVQMYDTRHTSSILRSKHYYLNGCEISTHITNRCKLKQKISSLWLVAVLWERHRYRFRIL